MVYGLWFTVGGSIVDGLRFIVFCFMVNDFWFMGLFIVYDL